MARITNPRQFKIVLELANKLLEEVARAHNLAVNALRGNDRFVHFVQARREFCRLGREANIQTKVLASALNCHHSTIVYHANEQYRLIKNAAREHSPSMKARRLTYQPQGDGYAEVP